MVAGRRAALAPGREPARRLAAGVRAAPSRGASRSTWPACFEAARESVGARRRGGASSASTPSCRRWSPTRCSSSAPSPTCSRTASATAAAGRCWSARARRGGRLVVRVVDRGRASPSGERERIFEPFYRREGSGQGLRPRPGDRQGVRRGQRRRDRGRVAAGAGEHLRRHLPAGTGGGGVSEQPPRPRLRRRAADRPRAEGDPARRRLRGGAGEHRRGGARPASPCARRRRRSST